MTTAPGRPVIDSDPLRRTPAAATLATGQAKDYGVRAESLGREWQARANVLGFDARAQACATRGEVPASSPESRICSRITEGSAAAWR